MAITITITVLVCVIVVLSAFLVSHRRRILALNIDIDALPDIREGVNQIAGLTGGSVMAGNAAEVLQNGLLLKRMMDDIEAARYTVHFETYLWRKGEFERQLVELFCSKARQGVKVRVLIDALGAIRARDKQLKKLRESGAELVYFRHIKHFKFSHLNNRTHRKILVVDGCVGYTCGHGVSDEWLGDAEDKHHWRDTGVRLTGPIVHSIQSVFTYDWCGATRDVPVGAGCFPEQPRTGNVAVHVVSSSTKSRDSSVALFYMMAIASARHEVIIQNPYFIPHHHIRQLLVDKARAGVKIRLMLPGECTDSKSVRFASQRVYLQLLKAGVDVYEFQPTMMHQKVIVIDGVWTHIGSTNFDLRSLVLNAEIGVGILDKKVAQDVCDAFSEDLKRSRHIRLDEWLQRPLWLKVLEWLMFQIRGQI